MPIKCQQSSTHVPSFWKITSFYFLQYPRAGQSTILTTDCQVSPEGFLSHFYLASCLALMGPLGSF